MNQIAIRVGDKVFFEGRKKRAPGQRGPKVPPAATS